jgi:hypothetical protein
MLAACTSTTEVMVKPDQLFDLAGLEGDKERSFTAVGHAKPMMARGDDEVRLLVKPGHMPGTPGEPWVKLCDLRFLPTKDWAVPDGFHTYAVDIPNIAGADVRMTRFDGGLTAVLVGGIVASALAAVGFVAWELSQERSTATLPQPRVQ